MTDSTAMRVVVHTGDPAPLAGMLSAEHPEVEFTACDSYAELSGVVDRVRPDAAYIIKFDNRSVYPRDVLLQAEELRWIAVGGSGVDHLRPWDTGRVTVTNSAGVAADMMVEYILGGFLHFTLDVPGLQRDQQARHWDAARLVRPLAGRTLLIAGLGHTGQALAARAKAFGMQVIGTRARPRETENVDEVHSSAEITGLWGRADFIAICTPLLAETRNLVDAGAFAAMKPGAIFADVSRGGVVNEAALVDALQCGHLGGAVLDVFTTEPLPSDSPVWTLPNTLISPHCSSVYAEWEMNSARMFSANLRRWRNGEPLRNIVDPQRGY